MDLWELQQLAGAALGMSEDDFDSLIDEDESLLDDRVYEVFNVDLETFGVIAEALLPLTPIVEKAISKEHCHAFVNTENGFGTIIVSQQVKKAAE